MPLNYLITGGAGFIGSNYAARLLQRNEKVTILDNLSRVGAERNLDWLRTTYGEKSFDLVVGDIRDSSLVDLTVRDADVILHLAGQVAVTTSVQEPRTDFEINAYGTFNVVEAARRSKRDPVFIYASTNKVYGGMENVGVIELDTRYTYRDFPEGISEENGLDFHSPYGCSKGCGDQYVRDYNRIYGLRSVVMRQSCIYGMRQFGVEDQGWVAWFVIAAIKGLPISIYGNGKQVRDILFIEDLCDAYDMAIDKIDKVAGRVFNIGGGPRFTMSIWHEFGPILEKLLEKPIPVTYGNWRPGDQWVYISDIRKAEGELGWQPKVGVEEGVTRLFYWVKANQDLF
jgi:CDP-paratose 2-epimerase